MHIKNEVLRLNKTGQLSLIQGPHRGRGFSAFLQKNKNKLKNNNRATQTQDQEMIKEVITLCRPIVVNAATSAAGERSFSTVPRLKNKTPFKMEQERFSNLTVLIRRKERTDRLSTVDIRVIRPKPSALADKTLLDRSP